MTKYPQVSLNIHVCGEGKLAFYTDYEIKKAIDDAKATLGTAGRIVVRPSGTEPLIRVMTEGADREQIEKTAQDVADVINARLCQHE